MVNAKELYEYFLLQIRRKNSPEVPPARGIELLNAGGQIWLEENAPNEGEDQTDDDRLRAFRSISIIVSPYALPADYFRATKVEAKIRDVSNSCIQTEVINGVTVSKDFLKTKKYRSDIDTSSYFRIPRESRLYYELRGNTIYLIGATIYSFRLRYLKKFITITNVTGSPTDLSAYNDMVLKEIANTAALIHLENVESRRMATFMNREMISNFKKE